MPKCMVYRSMCHFCATTCGHTLHSGGHSASLHCFCCSVSVCCVSFWALCVPLCII